MPDLHPLDAPLNVAIVDGEVVVTHPSGPAAVALTPTAALATGERLVHAAHAILGEPIFSEPIRDEPILVQSSQTGAGEE